MPLVSVTMAATDRMTKYTSDIPDTLWETWKETIPRSMNLNEGLVRDLADLTLEKRGDELDEDTKTEIRRIRDEATS